MQPLSKHNRRSPAPAPAPTIYEQARKLRYQNDHLMAELHNAADVVSFLLIDNAMLEKELMKRDGIVPIYQ